MTTSLAGRPAKVSTLFGPGTVETLIFALSLLTGPVLSRALGDEGRGTLAAVLVPTQLFAWAIALGVPYASAMLIQRYEWSTLMNGAWGVTALVGLPVSAILFLTAPALLSGHPTLALDWYRFGLIGTWLSIPAGTALQLRLMATGATWGLSTAKSVHLVVNSAAVVLLAVTGRLSLATALASWLVSYLASRVAILAVLNGRPLGLPQRSVMRHQLVMGRAQAVVTVATISLGRIDQVFLAFLAPSSQLGVYAVAATAAQVSLPLARGFADVVLPDAFARPGEDISRRATLLVFAISAFLGVVSAAVAPWLIPALFGNQFTGSVRLLWLLIPGQVLFNTAWVISAKHLGTGRPGVAARAIGVAALLNLVAIAPAIDAFGTEGAAVLTSVCQAVFLAGVLSAFGSRKRTGGRPSPARAGHG